VHDDPVWKAVCEVYLLVNTHLADGPGVRQIPTMHLHVT
jgi:hypothetical protein